jgi:hypothetical protein
MDTASGWYRSNAEELKENEAVSYEHSVFQQAKDEKPRKPRSSWFRVSRN